MTTVTFDQDWRYWRRGETAALADNMATDLRTAGIAHLAKSVTEATPDRRDKMIRQDETQQKHFPRRRKDKRRRKHYTQ